jgi:transcription termination factor Rho
VTETNEAAAPRKRGGGLNSMLIADLRAMAEALGVPGAGGMKKAQLVEAIKGKGTPKRDEPAPAAQQAEPPAARSSQQADESEDRAGSARTRHRQGRQAEQAQQSGQDGARKQDRSEKQSQPEKSDKPDRPDKQPQQGKADKTDKADKQNQQNQQNQQDRQSKDSSGQQQGDQDADGSRRNRRRRGRERTRPGTTRSEPDTQILEDDVLVPAAGILDVLDNYAFVRTSGYLPGVDDVYLSLSMVRKFGLRRGDAVMGQVRQPREGERREKFNPMVRIDSVNGADPEVASERVDFAGLTPVHPSERLRLETGPDDVTGRVIDLVAPLGKGQRALLLAPPRAGRTKVLQSIATALTTNDPECHLMVVLVDERPEEVTDFQRSVKGEVIASTLDRPAQDHVSIAELALERAKRLVELGHDVVILLDGLTRLGRAYQHTVPASGRALDGGMDAGALHPPKRFFGAARNVEGGGSLTVLATAVVESGSRTDEVILEELADTSNLELRLDRDLAERGLFPAVDVRRSGTRRAELLLDREEQHAVERLRAAWSEEEPAAALRGLLEKVQASRANRDLLGLGR